MSIIFLENDLKNGSIKAKTTRNNERFSICFYNMGQRELHYVAFRYQSALMRLLWPLVPTHAVWSPILQYKGQKEINKCNTH